MTVDSSSLLAIFFRERGYELLLEKLVAAPARWMSACTLVESHIVVGGRFGPIGSSKLSTFVEDSLIEVVAFTPLHAELARQAFLRFGKGRHRARLNFGDCITYALAISLGEPLLFTGEDFSQTDVLIA